MQIRPRDVSPDAIELRPMTEADLVGADELRQLAGWNQTIGDWRRLLQLEPGGCFVAVHNRVLAGTVTTTVHGSRLAWIGMMLVHPEHRRKGIATGLMQRALEYLRQRHIECVKLDATPAGQPLYEQLGFANEWTLQRWQRPGGPGIDTQSLPGDVRDFSESDWPVVLALDEAAFGVERWPLLRRLVDESVRVMVSPATGKPSCWGLLRTGTESDYLGPVACAPAEGAMALIQNLLAHSVGRNVTWDIPDNNQAAQSIARTLGFAPVRVLTRMRLGPRADATQPQSLFGIADPAVG